MWMTKVSINNPVFATMVMVAIMVLGLFSYQRLSVDQMPDISIPVAVVEVPYVGASAEAVEQDVIRPLEERINTVNGIKSIRSGAQVGFGWVAVEFQLSVDPRVAVQDVRDKVAEARRGFNRDVGEPTVSRRDNDNDQPVLYLAMRSDARSLRELSDIADQLIIKRLQGSAGVGGIVLAGDVGRELAVNLRPEKMAAFGIGVNEVINAIRTENQDTPAGTLVSPTSERTVRIKGKIRSADEFAKIIVARRGGVGNITSTGASTSNNTTAITLGQIADVSDSQREETSYSTMDGKRSISIQIRKTRGANSIEMSESVRKQLDELKKLLPPDIVLEITQDSSTFIKQGIRNVKHTILEGAFLTILIVFLFLHSWRSTVITGLTLPISLLATFIALYAFGFTINFLTLMAMSLSIGILIDDAIVVRENIVRHLAMGKSHKQAAFEATNEIGLAVMATTFTIVAVFLPVAFMGGIIGKFFFQFGITVVTAVLVSLFVSFTLDPMLSSVWHDPKPRWMERGVMKWIFDKQNASMDWLHRVYDRWLRWALAHRKSTIAMALMSLVLAVVLSTQVGGDFMPQEDNNWTSVQIQTPIGSSLEYTKSKAAQVELALRDFKEIKRINMNVWRTNAWFELELVDRKERKRSQRELDDAIRDRLASIAGLEINIGFNRPIQVFVMGPDIRELDRISNELITRMKGIKGLVDIESSFKPTNPALDIVVNRELASDLGVSMSELGLTTRALIAGEPAGQWQGPDGENHQVLVRLPRSQREGISDLDKIFVRANGVNADGTPRMVPLRQIADFQPSASERRIDRRNMQRQVRIMSGIAKDANAGDMSLKVREITDSMTLPPGYRFQFGGSSADMFETLGYALGALAIAVIFIYLVLASQFGSFLQPIAIMASLPLSLIGVVISLLLFGSNFNLFSVIGFIMLMGLVTKNAILLVDFTNQGIREGKSREEAILDAGQVRLRPIVMTTAAMIFGMIPLALAFGAGSEMQSPMAHAIIGGIITSTIMTLVVVPVLYTYMDSLGAWASRWFAKGAPPEFHRDSMSGILPNTNASGGSTAPVLQAKKED